MTGSKTYKEIATEKLRGRKRYLERIQEERESKELLKEYFRTKQEKESTYEDSGDVSRPD